MSRSELAELVAAFADQLDWQAAGCSEKIRVEKANALDRQSFESERSARSKRESDKLIASLQDLGPQASPSQDATQPTPPYQQQQNQKPESAPPDTSTPAHSLWKTTGSRPSITFQSNPDPETKSTLWEASDSPEVKLQKVRDKLGKCTRCALSAQRSNIVFGVGSPNARLMFIGEAPGFNEDKQGEPFVGKAGELLDKMIGAMGLSRAEIYIANVIKCRPPSNRDPEDEEINQCSPFLKAQIHAIKPEVIVSVGKFSSNMLCGTEGSLSAIRGKWHDYRGIPLMPTFHPAFLLRNPSGKREAWSDLQQVMKKLGL